MFEEKSHGDFEKFKFTFPSLYIVQDLAAVTQTWSKVDRTYMILGSKPEQILCLLCIDSWLLVLAAEDKKHAVSGKEKFARGAQRLVIWQTRLHFSVSSLYFTTSWLGVNLPVFTYFKLVLSPMCVNRFSFPIIQRADGSSRLLYIEAQPLPPSHQG